MAVELRWLATEEEKVQKRRARLLAWRKLLQ
jgi:hypothetical protein